MVHDHPLALNSMQGERLHVALTAAWTHNHVEEALLTLVPLAELQQFPLMTCESYATIVADSSVRVSTIHFRLLQRFSRCDMRGCLVESRLISSWRRSSPHWWEVSCSLARGCRGNAGRLRGINRNDGAGLLEAIQEGFEQLAHGRKGIVIKQCSHSLPQHALAAQLCPHRLEQGATQLLGLVHQERQHHQHGKHDGEMLRAMPVIVLEVVALIFQGIKRLIFNLPAGSSTPHEVKDVTLVHS